MSWFNKSHRFISFLGKVVPSNSSVILYISLTEPQTGQSIFWPLIKLSSRLWKPFTSSVLLTGAMSSLLKKSDAIVSVRVSPLLEKSTYSPDPVHAQPVG